MSNKLLAKLLLIPMVLAGCTAYSAEMDETGSPSEDPIPKPAFSDVEEGDKYYMSITYLREQGIIDGYDDNTFRAYEDINRAEALKMLTLASGAFIEEEIVDVEDPPFTDTPETEWYAKYLAAAKEKGIITGYDDNSFKPGKTINLAESLAIYIGSFEDVAYPNFQDYLFDDTPIDAWFIPYTAYAASHELINVYSSNTINPNQEMTRGYLAEIIYRMEMSKEGYNFGKATFYGAAVQGNGTASGETFDMYQMTAAHKTLAFGTIVEVTNLANGKSVQVKINDRGPYGPGRVIDLTSSAFEKIGWLGTGIISVQYKIISTP